MLCVLPFKLDIKQTYKRILFHRLHNPGGTRIFSVLGEFACTQHGQSSHRYSLHMRPPLGLEITPHSTSNHHLDSLATNVKVFERDTYLCNMCRCLESLQHNYSNMYCPPLLSSSYNTHQTQVINALFKEHRKYEYHKSKSRSHFSA